MKNQFFYSSQEEVQLMTRNPSRKVSKFLFQVS